LVLTFAVQLQPAPVAASSPHSLPAWFPLSSIPADITFSDKQPIIEFLARIVATGDFNGDGIADFLVTYERPTTDTTPSLAKAGIIFGKKDLNTPEAIDLTTTPLDLTFTFTGKLPLGTAAYISSIGDLNGDKIDDIVVTTVSSSGLITNQTVTGYYVLFGSPDLKPGTLEFSGIKPDVTIATPQKSGLAVEGYAAIGDVNGDGIPDVVFITGITGALLPASGVRAVITLGPFASGRTVDLQSGPADAYVSGVSPVLLADVNGDGVADLLVGDGSDALNIFLGSASLKGGIQVSKPDARIVGNKKSDYLTSSVAARDINGDGIPDIILGSLNSTTPTSQAAKGEVYVIFGSHDLAGRTIDVAQNQQDVTIVDSQHGLGGLGAYGWVATADINGDGIADIIVSNYAADGPGKREPRAGAIYIVLGSRSLVRGATVDIASFQQDASIFGPGANQFLGYQLIGGGDFNGSGFEGIVASSVAGTTYAFLGGPLRPPVVTAAVFNKGTGLVISGTDLAGAAEVEINGSVVAGAAFIPSQATVSLTGSKRHLNLRPGDNQIVVIRKGTRSNVFTLTL